MDNLQRDLSLTLEVSQMWILTIELTDDFVICSRKRIAKRHAEQGG